MNEQNFRFLGSEVEATEEKNHRKRLSEAKNSLLVTLSMDIKNKLNAEVAVSGFRVVRRRNSILFLSPFSSRLIDPFDPVSGHRLRDFEMCEAKAGLPNHAPHTRPAKSEERFKVVKKYHKKAFAPSSALITSAKLM